MEWGYETLSDDLSSVKIYLFYLLHKLIFTKYMEDVFCGLKKGSEISMQEKQTNKLLYCLIQKVITLNLTRLLSRISINISNKLRQKITNKLPSKPNFFKSF